MEYRVLGRSGLKVGEIAYGNWISRPQGGQDLALKEALEQGIAMFDTADVYGGGLGEEVLGRPCLASAGNPCKSARKSILVLILGPTGRACVRDDL